MFPFATNIHGTAKVVRRHANQHPAISMHARSQPHRPPDAIRPNPRILAFPRIPTAHHRHPGDLPGQTQKPKPPPTPPPLPPPPLCRRRAHLPLPMHAQHRQRPAPARINAHASAAQPRAQSAIRSKCRSLSGKSREGSIAQPSPGMNRRLLPSSSPANSLFGNSASQAPSSNP